MQEAGGPLGTHVMMLRTQGDLTLTNVNAQFPTSAFQLHYARGTTLEMFGRDSVL